MNQLPCIMFGGGGHEREYVLSFDQYDSRNFIPRSIELALQERLPGWAVDNRGTRIEIVHKEPYGIRNDAEVYPAVLEVCGAFNAELPILLVLDEESGDIVRCAILRESADAWTVKPLCEREFDEKEWIGSNRAFHMAFWRIAKNDGSAELAPGHDRYWTGNLHRLVVEKAAPYYAQRAVVFLAQPLPNHEDRITRFLEQ